MTTTTAPEYKVGDKLWFVPKHNGEPSYCTIHKVGRRWLTVSLEGRFRDYRADRNTLKLDDGAGRTPGTLHLSRESYEAGVAARAIWRQFQDAVRNGRPRDGVTIDDIREAARLLRIPLEGT